MINWADVQVETDKALTSVRQQIAFYQQRIAELNAESSKLSAALEVAQNMQESGYVNRLVSPQTVEPSTPVPSVPQQKQDLQTPAAFTLDSPRVEEFKTKWQTSIHALAELPELPPAIGITRQPGKTNTSYRVAQLLREAGHELEINDIIAEFERRNWIDPSWARPKEAITIAARRSEQYGWAVRKGKHTFAFSPESHDHRREASETNG
ncbi:hypothetical protein [Pseudarthrobacter sp. H2]|uniref:hypothetical protein n=1 Tax=Pseudarthrobacter sp. H2 TaxID=3418415 RepID=UPI003CEC8936